MEELEKAKLLSVAKKLAEAQIQEVREELLEQINSIQIPKAINGLDGRGITDARIFEGQLIFQLSDGALVTAGSVLGEQGPVGPVGARGEKGDKGDPGEKGDKGDPGSDADITKLEKKLNEFSDQVDKRLSKVAFNVAAKGGGGPAGSGEVWLHRLDDVDYNSVKNPSNGQSLVWSSSTSKWRASGNISVGTISVSEAILPSGTTPVNIGSFSKPFGSLFISSNTIYIGNAAISSSANGSQLIIPNETYFANGTKVGVTIPDIITANGTVNLNPYLQVANANAKFATKAYAASNTYVNNKFATKAYAAANSYVNTIKTSKANYYYSNTMYNYTAYGLGYMNVAPNQDPVTLGFRTDVPVPPFGSIWILAVNDGLVDPAPITIYSPNTRTTPMLWMSIDGTGPYDAGTNPNGQAYWFNITPPPSGV